MGDEIQREIKRCDGRNRTNWDAFDRGVPVLAPRRAVEAQYFVVALATLVCSRLESYHRAAYFTAGLTDGLPGFERNSLGKRFALGGQCGRNRAQDACPGMCGERTSLGKRIMRCGNRSLNVGAGGTAHCTDRRVVVGAMNHRTVSVSQDACQQDGSWGRHGSLRCNDG